jgi:tetratricopeptide (TPR) repeat protein
VGAVAQGKADRKLAAGRPADGPPRPPASQPARPQIAIAVPCSDTAARPLHQRIVLWKKRVASAANVGELIARYQEARATCEVNEWSAESALLELIQARIRTPDAARTLLLQLAAEPHKQRMVARAILRRTVDPQIAIEVRRILFGEHLRWAEIDAKLAELPTPAARLARLRQILAEAKGDPEGELRLVRALAAANQPEEALSLGRRLRDRGLLGPALALSLGDVLARQGQVDEALRTYSEIVEFDPQSPGSRRLLGDVCLRHGWYVHAYRHYRTLVDLQPQDPTALLRLAVAAAGSGRVDEALRVQRQVLASEGPPGPADPRMWARLWSAALLARLIDEAQSGKGAVKGAPSQLDALFRKLKELQLQGSAGVLQLLTWEDLEAGLALVPATGELTAGESFDASVVGLAARLLPPSEAERSLAVRWRKDPPGRPVAYAVSTIAWDGKTFKISVRRATLAN